MTNSLNFVKRSVLVFLLALPYVALGVVPESAESTDEPPQPVSERWRALPPDFRDAVLRSPDPAVAEEESLLTTCGPDSLWYVLMQLGRRQTLASVRSEVPPTSPDGFRSFADLAEHVRASGFEAFALSVGRETLGSIAQVLKASRQDVGGIVYVPAEFGHFAPVSASDGTKLQLFDFTQAQTFNLYVDQMEDGVEVQVLVIAKPDTAGFRGIESIVQPQAGLGTLVAFVGLITLVGLGGVAFLLARFRHRIAPS